MEYFDVLTPEGELTGKKKPRHLVHQDGDWHRAVNLWILNSQAQLLIQKRAPEKDTFPGFWDLSCCGHLSAGDTSLDTAIREAKEELGINLEPEKLQFITTIQEQNVHNDGTFFDNEFRDIYYTFLDLPLDAFTLQPEEVVAIEWIPLEKFASELENFPGKYVPHDVEYPLVLPMLTKILNQAT